MILRYMRPADVAQVVAIDRMAFSMPWTPSSYAYEITDSKYSHMVALELPDDSEELPDTRGWRRLIRSFASRDRGRILGYGGLWNIADEAHISTIATHPDERGKGYGEILLAGMIRKSIHLNAAYIVLEVRVGNLVAQNLYQKYEFETVDTKRNYYRDDNEDAYDMRLDLAKPGLTDRFEARWKEIHARLTFHDFYTHSTPRY